MKLLKILNYILLMNAIFTFGFIIVNTVYLRAWNLTIAIVCFVSLTIFIILAKVEDRLKDKLNHS